MRGITVFLLVVLALCGLSYWYFANGYSLPSFSQTFHTVVIPTLTPAVSPPTVAKTLPPQVVHSPDGTKKLTLEITQHSNGSASYDVVASDISGSNPKHIFTTVLARTESISIPDNTWSPDNAFVFLKESTSTGEQVFVLKASGDSFTNGKEYLDVVPLFDARGFSYKFVDATGWADPTLLILVTSTKDGQKGPLFWFVVPSSGFMQLAR